MPVLQKKRAVDESKTATLCIKMMRQDENENDLEKDVSGKFVWISLPKCPMKHKALNWPFDTQAITP